MRCKSCDRDYKPRWYPDKMMYEPLCHRCEYAATYPETTNYKSYAHEEITEYPIIINFHGAEY